MRLLSALIAALLATAAVFPAGGCVREKVADTQHQPTSEPQEAGADDAAYEDEEEPMTEEELRMANNRARVAGAVGVLGYTEKHVSRIIGTLDDLGIGYISDAYVEATGEMWGYDEIECYELTVIDDLGYEYIGKELISRADREFVPMFTITKMPKSDKDAFILATVYMDEFE